jgi:WD40 repeat protein
VAERHDEDGKTGTSEGFLELNKDELKTLAEAVGESDAGKIAGAAAALATKALTGSSAAAAGVEKAVAKAFGRWFADHPDVRMKALAAAWKREDARAATLGQFAALVRPMLENLQRATADQLDALLAGQDRAAAHAHGLGEDVLAASWQQLGQLAQLADGQQALRAALKRLEARMLPQVAAVARRDHQPLHLRIFVSSPGDVPEERRLAAALIAELAERPLLRGVVTTQVVAWDAEGASAPMDATRTPQDAVNDYAGLPSECDLTLVFLWSRLGTPLPRDKVRADGSPFESGTVWELEDAERAGREVWIYRRDEEPIIKLRDPKHAEKLRSFEAVEDFFHGFNHPDGSIRRGYHRYQTLAELERMLREHLEHFVARRLRQRPPELEPPVVPPKPAPSGWPRAHDFTGYLAEKRAHFVGRSDLFAKVDAWLGDAEGARALLVVADFGVGKTAFAAELVARKHVPIVAHHFCHADEDLTLEPATFVATVAAQLAESLPAYRTLVDADEALQKKLGEVTLRPTDVFSQAVIAPLWSLAAPPKPVVLLVDALDEALDAKDVAGTGTIVAMLAQHAARLPTWVRILATSRNREAVTKPLKQAFRTDLFDAESQANLDDLRTYVLARCGEAALAERLVEAKKEPEELARALVAKAGGKFLYVVRILPEFTWATGARSLADLDSLPAGMDAFYADAFARRFRDRERYRAQVAPVLSVFCAQREAMARTEVAEVVGLTTRDVAEVVQQVRDFVRVSPDHRAAFDHVSLSQWLTEEAQDAGLPRAGAFEIGKADAEARLSAWALRRLEARTAHDSIYLARHLPAHLAPDTLVPAYRAALLDVRWLEVRLAAVGLNGLLADFEAPRVQQEEVLRLLQSAVRLSSHVLQRRPDELAAQLAGRLLGHAHVELATLAEQARVASQPPSLVPCSACLEAPGGPLLRTLGVQTKRVAAVALSRDGTRALSGSGDKTLKLWDTDTGQCLQTFEGHTGSVESVALSRDGTRALSGSWDQTLKLWDTGTGRCIQTFEGHSKWVNSVTLSRDGTRALSGSQDNTLKLWDTSTGRCLQTFEGHTESVESVALSRDGTRALSGSQDNTLKLWDTGTGRCLQTFEGHTLGVRSVALSRDGTRALSGSHDNALKLWDTGTGRCLQTFEGHTESVESVALSRDGTRALSGSFDNTLKLWDTGTGQRLRAYEGHTGSVELVALSRDGTRALSGSRDTTLKLWDTGTGRCIQTFEGHSKWVNSVTLSRDGTRALSGSGDKTLKLWDTGTGRCLRTFEGHTSYVSSVALSRDGTRVLSGSGDKTLKLWDTDTGQCLRAFEEHTSGVFSVALSRDGTRALSGSHDNALKLWDTSTGRCLQTFEGHTGNWVNSVTLSRDGTRALSGSQDHTLRLWETDTGQCLQILEGHTENVSSVALSRDGARALSGSWDQTLKLWDVQAGRVVAACTLDASVNAVALAADGRRVVAGTSAGRVCFFEVRG